MNPNENQDKPRYTQPGKTPGQAEGELEPRRREVDPGKTPGKVEGEQFDAPGVSRENPGPEYHPVRR